ncbi:MAG: MotA/TolQ/ExbB proton channel family protein [Bacteroidota bacterium]
MIELFYEGGPLFMGILTLIALAMFSTAFITSLPVLKGDSTRFEDVKYIKSVGLLALIVGIFFQLISLYQGFEAIERLGSVSPALLAGGLKYSMITTIYGFLIYISALLIWLGLYTKIKVMRQMIQS